MEINQELSPNELLNEAAELIEIYGWCRGHYGNEVDGFCALGALGRAAGHRLPGLAYQRPNFRGSLKAARDKLMSATSYDIASWNDNPDRTKEEVITKFRELAQQSQPNQPQSSITT